MLPFSSSQCAACPILFADLSQGLSDQFLDQSTLQTLVKQFRLESFAAYRLTGQAGLDPPLTVGPVVQTT